MLTRLLGMLLAALSVQFVIEGINDFFLNKYEQPLKSRVYILVICASSANNNPIVNFCRNMFALQAYYSNFLTISCT